MNTNNMNTNSDRPALVSITESGTFRLRLCQPKPEKYIEADGVTSVKLFFLGESGLCLSKKYSTAYPKQIATLVGRFTGTYCTLTENASTDALLECLSPAFNKWADIELEVTQNEWNGKTYPKYTFKKITAVKTEGSGASLPPAKQSAPEINADDLPY